MSIGIRETIFQIFPMIKVNSLILQSQFKLKNESYISIDPNKKHIDLVFHIKPIKSKFCTDMVHQYPCVV